MRAILLGSGLAIICSLLGTRLAIGWFTRHGFGQPIRDDGPTTHHIKRGTPTMGGLVILLSATAAYLGATVLTGGRPSASAWLLLLLFFGCGVVGFLDDFIKGLHPAQPRADQPGQDGRADGGRPRIRGPGDAVLPR